MIKNILQKLFKNKKLLVIVIIAILVGGYFIRKTIFPSTNGYEEAKIERGTVKEELILTGEVQAGEHAKLSFLTSGELDYVGVTEGQEVKNGDILARLDTTILYQAYLSAEADLRRYDASKDKTYDDLQGHENDESYAQIETRTIAETYRDKAYRAYVSAQKNLSNASLRAPFDGIVASITHPYTGINTSLTESQIEIVNPYTIYFQVSADQSEVGDISVGQDVTIVLDSFPDEDITGRVDFVGITPMAGEVSTVYSVKVLFDDNSQASKLRIGMTGDAKFVLAQKDSVLYIPVSFLNTDSSGKYLRLGKTNNKVYVDVGLEGEEYVEIVSDKVKEGDVIYD